MRFDLAIHGDQKCTFIHIIIFKESPVDGFGNVHFPGVKFRAYLGLVLGQGHHLGGVASSFQVQPASQPTSNTQPSLARRTRAKLW